VMDTLTDHELRPNVKVYFDLYLANNGLPSRLAQPGIKNKLAFKCKSITLRKNKSCIKFARGKYDAIKVHNRRGK